MKGSVVAVSRSPRHKFSKSPEMSIRLLAGLGVEGDAHMGETVKHRSRVRVDPTQPNLRQVHLVHAELHDELRAAGFKVHPGDIGENITSRGIDLLGLPTGTVLRIGETAVTQDIGRRTIKTRRVLPDVLDQSFAGHGRCLQMRPRSASTSTITRTRPRVPEG